MSLLQKDKVLISYIFIFKEEVQKVFLPVRWENLGWMLTGALWTELQEKQ